MGLSEILANIDHEIAQLQSARALIASASTPTAKKRPGRPKKVAALAVPSPAIPATKKKKRNLSPEGRKRIAEAVKRRWVAQRKAAAVTAK
jgi:hypothetical protein